MKSIIRAFGLVELCWGFSTTGMMNVLLFLLSGLSLMGGRISALGAFVSCIWRRGMVLKHLDVL